MSTYIINGTTYRQKPLVLGQVRQLSAALREVRFTSLEPVALVADLADSLADALAIVLIPEGDTVAGKDNAALADELSLHLDIETALRIIADFFEVTLTPGVFTALGTAVAKLTEKIGSSSWSASSLTETTASAS